jgi:hypothetical protein
MSAKEARLWSVEMAAEEAKPRKARIRKGVRPYGGRVFDVVKLTDTVVELRVDKAGQVLNWNIADVRVYRRHEVDLLDD